MSIFLERLKSTSTSAVTGTIVFVIKENMIFRTHARSKQFTVLFFSLEIYSGYRLVRNEPWLRIWWPLIANVEIFSILQMSDIYITLYICETAMLQ